MSRTKFQSPFILEWSPRGLRGYDAGTRTVRNFANLAEVAAVSREALVAVGRRSLFMRTVRVPNVGQDEVRQVLHLRMAELFPIPPSDLAYDFQLTDDVNSEGRLAVVAAMSSSELRKLHADAKSVGLRVVGVVPSASGAALLDGVGSEPHAVVQETADGLAVDIVATGVVRQSRVVSVPSQVQAEVCRTFAMAGLECGPIVAAGGTLIAGADLSLKESSLEALQRHQERIHLNLELPEVVVARTRGDQQRRQRMALLMLVAAAALGIYTFFDYQDANLNRMRKQTAANNVVKKVQDANAKVVAQLETASGKRAELDRGFRPAQRFGDVLTVVSNRTPAGVWLTGVTVERGKSLSVRGTATSNEAVAAFLRSLSTEPRLRDVRLVFANNSTIDDVSVVQFSISGFPVGNLPLIDQPSRRRS